MSMLPNVNGVQDIAPKGGYPRIRSVPVLKSRFAPGWVIAAGLAGAYFAGLAVWHDGIQDRKVDIQENRSARMAIYPVLEYEQDLRRVATIDERDAREAIIHENNSNFRPVGHYRYRHERINF